MICTCNNNIIITHSAHANSVKIIIILGDAAIKLTSTAQQNVLHPGEFATFFCIANGSRLVWTLNSMVEFSFNNLERMEHIIYEPLSDSYATLLPPGYQHILYSVYRVLVI